MKAAVVTESGRPPRCTDTPEPQPAKGEIVVDVLAAAIHPLVRSRAAGVHYSSGGTLPLTPGIDGVGRAADGTLRYFVLNADFGSMAERVAIDPHRSVVLPADTDPITVAAGMNPAMSSWVALRRRVPFEAGQSVLVLGATGNAGSLAVEVAKLLRANHIVAAGRNADRLAKLPELGATATVRLDGADSYADLARESSDVDVVLDYLWGEPTTAAMTALVTARRDRVRQLTWIEIGSMAGSTAAIPSAALRAAHLQLVGSGLGSVPIREFLAELPELASTIAAGTLRVDARPVPLADVEHAWAAAAEGGPRIVLTP